MGSLWIKALVNEGGGYKWVIGLFLSSVLKWRWSRQLACWLGSGRFCALLLLEMLFWFFGLVGVADSSPWMWFFFLLQVCFYFIFVGVNLGLFLMLSRCYVLIVGVRGWIFVWPFVLFLLILGVISDNVQVLYFNCWGQGPILLFDLCVLR